MLFRGEATFSQPASVCCVARDDDRNGSMVSKKAWTGAGWFGLQFGYQHLRNCDALRRVRLALALQSCAAAAAITHCRARLSGDRARLGSIVGGAMAGFVDATADHDGPGDPRGLPTRS